MYTENQDKPSEARQNGNILHTDYVGLIAAFMQSQYASTDNLVMTLKSSKIARSTWNLISLFLRKKKCIANISCDF